MFIYVTYLRGVKKPAVIMVTSNGVGAGHLIRASAIARELQPDARPIVFSMAYSVVEVASALNLECEYVPSRDKGLMPKKKWDRYLRDRLVALIDETGASVVTFDGVVPYPGIIAAKFARPQTSLVWVRRGMWQRKPQGALLGLQSKLMDHVIEPGDVARDADLGPTKNRRESVLMSPVSLYRKEQAMKRNEARAFLALDPEKPAILVQMGVGNSDLDARVSAVLRGLSGWRDLQIVMPREPRDQHGNSLVPDGMTVKIIRHFPLADVLHAFDAAVCAAGYNSVHEVIPAGIPTLFIANNRGTDDQEARARWCADNALALFATNDLLEDIAAQSAKLKFQTLRVELSKNCQAVGAFDGAKEIAGLVKLLTNETYKTMMFKRFQYQRFLAINFLTKSPTIHARRFVNMALRGVGLVYRSIRPHNELEPANGEVVFSYSRDFKSLDKYIRTQERFEHLLANSSSRYLVQRKAIAQKAFGEIELVPAMEQSDYEINLKFAS
jgi:UDP-N-acetylglucosamine:LPS N-acetylglucosamine transferase